MNSGEDALVKAIKSSPFASKASCYDRVVKLVVIFAIAACTPQLYMPPPASPPLPDEAVLPAVDISIHAEANYAALVTNDSRLDRAADDLAYLVAHGGDATTDVATAVLRMHGIVEPPQHVVSGVVGDDLDPRFGEELFHPNTSIGRGTFGQTTVAILVYRPNIQIATIPRAIDGSIEIAFTLDPALRDPRVTVADATQSSHPIVTTDEEHEVRVTVPCDHATERYVTIEAVDPRTSIAPMVIFPLYCKLSAPGELHAEPAANLSGYEGKPAGLERRLAAILNRERATVNLRPLHRDPRVEAAAAAYAHDRAQGRRTDPATLMHDAGLIAAATSWTTFHVDSLESAINRVVNSPDQLDKLRDRERTDIGVGAERVVDGWWISIVYITIPPPLATQRAATLITNAIYGTSEKLFVDPIAADMAQRYAESLAIGWSRDDLEGRVKAAMRIHNGAGAEVVVDKRTDFDKLDIRALINKHRFSTFGVGVAQSARNGPLVGTLWIVVLFY